MKTNKTVMVTLLIKSLLVFLVGALLVSLFFSVSGAIYSLSRRAKGTLLMNQGIYVSLNNVNFSVENSEITGFLKYTNGSSQIVDMDNVSLDRTTNYTIELPYLSVQARSLPFYARAKFVYTVYDQNGDETTFTALGTTETAFLTELFSTYSTNGNSLLPFTSSWKSYSDGYHYYVTDNTAAVTTANLASVGSSNSAETLTIFTGANNQATITTGNWSSLNGGPNNVSKIDIQFKLELVETGAVSNWSLSSGV